MAFPSLSWKLHSRIVSANSARMPRHFIICLICLIDQWDFISFLQSHLPWLPNSASLIGWLTHKSACKLWGKIHIFHGSNINIKRNRIFSAEVVSNWNITIPRSETISGGGGGWGRRENDPNDKNRIDILFKIKKTCNKPAIHPMYYPSWNFFKT